MFVAMAAHTPCILCAYRVEVIMMGSARINKRSLRVTGPLLGALRFRECPECGSPVGGGVLPRSAYRLLPEDDAKVVAYRLGRWGIEDAGTGPPGAAVRR